MKKMLVVDSAEMNKSIINEIFSANYEIIQTNSHEVAFRYLTQYRSGISIVLINENIARCFAAETVATLEALEIFENVPVILILNSETAVAKTRNIVLPYSDVVSTPVNPYVIQKRVANLVELYSHKNELEDLIRAQTEKIVAQNQALRLQQKKINTINNDMLDTLSTVIEYRDVESGRHIHRIKRFTEVMLRALASRHPQYSMSEEKISLIASASALHDIGKIAIPDSILLTPRRLTAEEFEVMKQHTVKGCELLDQLESVEKNEYFTYCYDICRYHHEKYDGSGYPDGLRGERIPVWAQVVSIADCYDALTSERTYKAAFSHDQAAEMIRTGACGVFSDVMLDCFGAVLSDFKKLAAEYADVNHADRSVREENGRAAFVDPDGDNSGDIYRKLDRTELIRLLEHQKSEMLRARAQGIDVLNKISDYVFEFDLERDCAYARKGSFEALFGYRPKNYSEAVGLFSKLCSENHRSPFVRTFRREHILEELESGIDRVVSECPMTIGGTLTAVRCTAAPIKERGRLSRIYLSLEELEGSAMLSGLGTIDTNRDVITGLWNFNGLKNEIEDFLSHSGRKGRHLLMMIDIDGFRSINRSTGYRFGDEILKDIAELLRQQFGDSNIIGRVEEDNFLVFVNDCPDKEESFAIVDHIFNSLHKTYTFNGKTYPEISACIGVADYPRHGENFEELFFNASKAVDIAKINGKNMYLFYNDNMKTSWELSTYANGDLAETGRTVLDFERYFIPLFDSVTDRITCYEIVENSSEYGADFDFDEIYSALYSSRNITAISLNSIRRMISCIYTMSEEGINLPEISLTAMFKGYDSEIVVKAFEEILSVYPVNTSNICINFPQDMLQSMDMRQTAALVEFFRSRGFRTGIYNVGMNFISTRCFTSRLFDRVIMANAFIDDVADGIIPIEILIYLIECFTGLGTRVCMPMNADHQVLHELRAKCGIPYDIYSEEYIRAEDFVQQGREEDVHEYPALEHEKNSLVISDRVYDEILGQTHSFILEWNPHHDSVKFSASFERMYGYVPPMFDFVKGIRSFPFVHEEDATKLTEKLGSARSDGQDTECIVRIYNMKKGEYVWNRVHIMALRSVSGIPAKIMAVFADISDEKITQSEEQGKPERTDTVTNVYHRTAAESKIKNYLFDEGATGSHALMIAEVCGYDRLVEALGEVFANAVLREAAEGIREFFRDSDIVGRVGDSHFVIFVKGISSVDMLKEKSRQICGVIDNCYHSEDNSIPVSGKVGISMFPGDGRTYDELYNSAMQALYYARHSITGRSAFAYDPSIKRLTDKSSY